MQGRKAGSLLMDKCKIKNKGKGYKDLICNGHKVAGYSPKRGMWGATRYFKKFKQLMDK